MFHDLPIFFMNIGEGPAINVKIEIRNLFVQEEFLPEEVAFLNSATKSEDFKFTFADKDIVYTWHGGFGNISGFFFETVFSDSIDVVQNGSKFPIRFVDRTAAIWEAFKQMAAKQRGDEVRLTPGLRYVANISYAALSGERITESWSIHQHVGVAGFHVAEWNGKKRCDVSGRVSTTVSLETL
jgi:hypothetical protein